MNPFKFSLIQVTAFPGPPTQLSALSQDLPRIAYRYADLVETSSGSGAARSCQALPLSGRELS